MKKYRKKPTVEVVIEAVQLKGERNKFDIAEFLKGHGEFRTDFIYDDDGKFQYVLVSTPMDAIALYPTDWLIRQGEELWATDNKKFKDKYEAL